MTEKKLRQAKLLLDFYFAPWGAAKGEIWECVSHDRAFNSLNMGRWAQAILSGQTDELTPEQEKLLRIVVE